MGSGSVWLYLCVPGQAALADRQDRTGHGPWHWHVAVSAVTRRRGQSHLRLPGLTPPSFCTLLPHACTHACMQAAVSNARSELDASQHQLQQEQAAAARLQQRLEEVQEQAMQVG